jgi:hypothetical protein
MRLRSIGILITLVAAALAATSTAGASQLIDRNATNVKLEVDSKGEAMITYTAGGQLKHVLAWGAVNASPPTQSHPQVAFKLDYSGGYGKYHIKDYWQRMGGVCLPYDGPKLAYAVAACKAPDGSYWALQSWQRGLPDYGVGASAQQASFELRLSHWTGAIPVLSITTDKSYGKYDHLFGTFTYGGLGVFGFKSTSSGEPLDTYGRNVYVDTFDSAYGTGWKRDNSFLTHGPGGSFCYGFYPHGSHPAGNGTMYRATIEGPGAAPDVMWQGSAPTGITPAQQSADVAAELALHDPKCTK